MDFDLTHEMREQTLTSLIERLESFYANTRALPATGEFKQSEVHQFASQFDFDQPLAPLKAIEHIASGLEQYAVHTPHPKYFGLFNPRANFAGVLADLATAVYNPQLAAWSHAPFAAEVEARVVKELAQKFGYAAEHAHGNFTTGGTEANLTALICALNHNVPNFAEKGIRGLDQDLVIYCSSEAHHSNQRAARTVGLGKQAVHPITANSSGCIDLERLKQAILSDMGAGKRPLMIVATAGSTGRGAIDDMAGIKSLATKYNVWFHVDAAYGGGAVLSSTTRRFMKGIELSDSLTFDAHKWMSVPMATSLFLTSHRGILAKTFHEAADYMPNDAEGLGVEDPHAISIQWSRRFIGLKVYLSLLIFGWEGYEQVINRQTNLANVLRSKLTDHNWVISNDSPLPVVCFSDPGLQNQTDFAPFVLQRIYASRKSWVSLYPIAGVSTFRACITNYLTNEADLDELVQEFNQHRSEFAREKTRPATS